MLGWLLVTPAAVAAVARLPQAEQLTALVWAGAVSQWLALPLLPAAWHAARRRSRTLLLVAALAVLHLSWLLPEALPSAGPVGAPDGPRLRLMTANLYDHNPDGAAMARAVVDSGADVVLLQEVTPEHERALRRAGMTRAYEHVLLDTRPGPTGSAILSRHELVGGRPWEVAGQPMTRAALRLPGRQLELFNVHPTAPVSSHTRRLWAAQLAALAEAAAGERGALVVAGDLNATTQHAGLRALLAAGLRDAHRELGRGLVGTWPANRWPVPPFLRLDRVLVSERIAVLEVAEATIPGSDHRAVIVDLVVGGVEGG